MVDSGIRILFHESSLFDIILDKFDCDFADIQAILFICTFTLRPQKRLENIHAADSILITASAYAVSGVVRFKSFQCKINEVLTIILAGDWFVCQNIIDYLCRNLIGMILIILGKQVVYLGHTGKEQRIGAC